MKKTLLPIVAIAIALSTASCTFKKESPAPGANGPTTIAEVREETFVDTRGDVVSIDATGSVAIAGELTNSGISSTEDVNLVAIINEGDRAGCKTLPENDRQDCLDAISFKEATFRDDYAKCELIEDSALRKDCVGSVTESLSKNAGTSADCAKIQDPTVRQNCETRVKALMNPTSQKTCESLSSPTDKLQCFDQLLLTEVRSGKTTDGSVCSKVVNPILKKECEVLIKNASATTKTATTTISKSDACSGKSGTNLEYCLREKAVTNKDASQCSPIATESIRTACVNDVKSAQARKAFEEAMTTKNPAACDSIGDASLRTRCKEIVKQ